MEEARSSRVMETPHFHGQGHVVCMYQFATLEEIVDKIERGLIETRSIRLTSVLTICSKVTLTIENMLGYGKFPFLAWQFVT